MTVQPVNDTAQEKPRLAVVPAGGSVLDDLLTQLQAAKAAQTEAEDRVKGLTAQVKAMLCTEHPLVGAFDIAGSPHRKAMTLTAVSTVRMDVKRLKNENPYVYAQYAVFGSHWVLQPARGAA